MNSDIYNVGHGISAHESQRSANTFVQPFTRTVKCTWNVFCFVIEPIASAAFYMVLSKIASVCAKAFDKVPHRRLLHKLDYYGIRGSTHKWINSWLSGRTQKVVLDGQASDPVPVLSGVPQGSVLGPILFLIFINDLPGNIRSSVHLFADNCVLYRNIHSIQDGFILPEDLTSLGQWVADWQMKFNVAKCHSMRVTRHQHPKQILFDYSLHNQTLENVQSAKYLGITTLTIWIGVNTFQKFLPKQLRQLVSFAGI